MKTRTLYYLIVLLISFVLSENLFAQVGINATGAAPDAKAILDINSTTKGFLWPRMTLVQRNAISTAPGVTPEGLTVFDTDSKNLWMWKNSAWQAYLPSPWEVSGVDIFNNKTGNVGIGTLTPQTKLHINTIASTIIRNETDGGSQASLELKTSAASFDFLELRKWATGASGFYGSIVTPTSIPLTGLSMLTSGTFSTGGLLIGTNTANPLYFSTNLTEKMRITADGNMGIGTTLPTQKLDIDGQIRIRGGGPAAGKVLTSGADGTATWENSVGQWNASGIGIINPNATSTVQIKTSATEAFRIEGGSNAYTSIYESGNYRGYIGSYSGEAADVDFGTGGGSTGKTHLVTNSTPRLTVDALGKVGIGITTLTHPLQMVSGAHCTAAGVWTNASDERLKKNISTLPYGLKEVMQLKPVAYNMKVDESKQVGFIAQEVQKVIPELISGTVGDLSKGENLGMSYGNLTAILTKAIQEQQLMIEQLKKEIASLKTVRK